jgi:hypothetical protein
MAGAARAGEKERYGRAVIARNSRKGGSQYTLQDAFLALHSPADLELLERTPDEPGSAQKLRAPQSRSMLISKKSKE